MIPTKRIGPMVNKRSEEIWNELDAREEPIDVLKLMIDISDARSNAQTAIMNGNLAAAQKSMVEVTAWGAVICGLLNEVDPKRALKLIKGG